MNSEVKCIVGRVLFIVAFLLPIVAMWRYTGFGLSANSFMISATVFHASVIVALVLFYVQWKIYPSTWIYVRQWFSEHVWSFLFGITILLICHSFLFFRFYIRQYERYQDLWLRLKAVKMEVDEIETVKESIDKFDTSIIEDRIDELKKSIDKFDTSIIEDRIDELKKSIDSMSNYPERTVPAKRSYLSW